MNLQQIKQINESTQFAWDYLTVQQFVERFPAFTLGGLRSQIFYENTNGLKVCGAIIRNGRRVLINFPKYFQWLEARNLDSNSGDSQ
jgi:hypothetical protein